MRRLAALALLTLMLPLPLHGQTTRAVPDVTEAPASGVVDQVGIGGGTAPRRRIQPEPSTSRMRTPFVVTFDVAR